MDFLRTVAVTLFHGTAPLSLPLFLGSSLLLVRLYPLRSLFKPSRRQAVASPPVVEPCLLVAPQTAVHRAAAVRGAVAAQSPAQHSRDQQPHLRHCQRRRLDFFPAWLPASGTRWRSATTFGGDASPPRSAPDSRPGPLPPWHAGGIPRCGAPP